MSGPTTGFEGGRHRFVKWRDVPITVHWTFWFNFIFQVIMAVIYYTNSWKYILLTCCVWGPFLLVFIVLPHEIGHLWANAKYNGDCISSVLWPLGGFSDTYIEKCTCLQELFVALAGPLTHIPKMFLWLLIMGISSEHGVDYYRRPFSIDEFNDGGADEWFAKAARELLTLEMIIFFLNILVPAYPLDAARILAALCVQCGLSVDKAGLTLVIIGGLMGLGASIYGITSLADGTAGNNGLLLLFLGLWLLMTTYKLYQFYDKKRITHHPIFQAECYSERRTYASGESGPSRNYTNGRRNQGDRKKATNRNDIEMQRQQSPRQSAKPKAKASTPTSSPPKKVKKVSYSQALKKAKAMKLKQLKEECRKNGVNTSGFLEKSEYEQAYAEKVSKK